MNPTAPLRAAGLEEREKEAPAREGEGQRQDTWGRPQGREERPMLWMAQASPDAEIGIGLQPVSFWLRHADAGSCVRALAEGKGPPLCADPTTPPVNEGPHA
jgi:hypothetical protein